MLLGFRKFRERYFKNDDSLYNQLAEAGQSPKTLMIACSDSRVDPAIIFSASPGEFFVVRNVANLVPPFEEAGGFHGVSAAIEFAVVNLQVENIVIVGHRQCGGIRSLFQPAIVMQNSFVHQWMKIANDAKLRVLQKNNHSDIETLCRDCEKESIITSLGNLKTFPFVCEAIKTRNMQLIGAYFDIESGELWSYDEEKNLFLEVTPD